MNLEFPTPRRSIATLLILGAASVALGQGRVYIDRPMRPIPQPGLSRDVTLDIKYQRVYTEITDGVAVTTIKQTFVNPLNQQVEGTYVFPLPDDVAVGDFVMKVGGKTMRGEVLDADQASKTYEQIVRKMRDPGLLEFIGQRLYKARVFPIPPRGEVEVEMDYSGALTESGGLGLFHHPLRIELPDGKSIGELLVHAKIHSRLPLTSVFCPSHKCEIKQTSDHEATVTYERSNVRPETDFQLYYQRKDAFFGLCLLTHRAAGEAGYFMLRLSPRIEVDSDKVLPKDIAFVIDTSGSMAGGKIEQVKKSLEYCSSSLNPGDRFNLLTFSTEVHPFRDGLVKVDADIREAALDFVSKLQAVGGTNINEALLSALAADPKDDDRPYLIVFMTDGQPTVGVTDPGRILKTVADRNQGHVRLHVLGVGTDVNTQLLDTLAEDARGTRDYCIENENLELKLSALVGRLSDPLLSDLKLRFGELNVSDAYPKSLPDLFRGTDVVVLGRYDGEGHHAVHLDGQASDRGQTLTYEGDFPKKNEENEFLPRLWATRKVGYLLDEIRLHGQNQELVDEVKRLAKKYGIVTPYTSALIVEDTALAAGRPIFNTRRTWAERVSPPRPQPASLQSLGYAGGGRDRRAAGGGGMAREDAGQSPAYGNAAFDPMVPESTVQPAHSGRGAVEASKLLATLKKDGTLDAEEFGIRTPDGKSIIRHVGKKTFVFDGVRWLDTEWDGKRETTKVEAFSDAYFELVKQDKAFARYLALGDHVVFVIDDKVYEVTPPPDQEAP